MGFISDECDIILDKKNLHTPSYVKNSDNEMIGIFECCQEIRIHLALSGQLQNDYAR